MTASNAYPRMAGRPRKTALKKMASFVAFPLTLTFPDAGETAYPATGPTENEQVPLGSMKVMLPAVELCLAPPSVTVHEVIDGRPVSLKVTGYLVTLKEIATCTGVPFTVTEAEAGEAVYPEMPPTAK